MYCKDAVPYVYFAAALFCLRLLLLWGSRGMHISDRQGQPQSFCKGGGGLFSYRLRDYDEFGPESKRESKKGVYCHKNMPPPDVTPDCVPSNERGCNAT